MKFFALLISLLAVTGTAWAGDALKPADFAYGSVLDTPGNSSVYEVIVPLDVYRGTTRPDLGDLRIFNAAGDIVPYVVAPGGVTEEDMTGTADLSVFPISEDVRQTPDALSVLIHPGDSGTEVNVQSGQVQQTQKKKIVAYLLDATQVAGPIRSLRLEWTAPSDTFLLPATLEASDDLKTWRTVIDDGLIAQLTLKDRQGLTSKDLLELPSTQAKYFRLKFIGQDHIVPGFDVTQVHATYVTGKKSADRQWTTVTASSVSPKSFVFDLGAELPVDRIEVLLPEGNHAIESEISSAAKPDDPQHPKTWRYKGLIYRLKEAGRDVSSGPFPPEDAASRTPQRYWYLDLEDDSSGFGHDLPSFKAGWVPEKIVFVAQGKGPYTLAYGSAGIRKAAFDSTALLQLEDNASLQHGIASLSKQRDLGGPSRLVPPPPAPPSLKEVWGKRLALVGMVLATLLLGFLAYRLARQMPS